MTDAPLTPAARTISRRTALKAGAWSVPVIAVTTAAPLAAATVPGWDLSLEPPQLGSDARVFTDDLTGIYTVSAPTAYVIGNRGSVASPSASITISLQVDRRIWSIAGMQYSLRGSGSAVDVPTSTPVIEGNLARYTWTIVASVPAHADYTNGIYVRVDSEFLLDYPDDHLDRDTIVPVTWILTPPAGDADPSNDVVAWSAAGPVEAVHAFGGIMDADWEGVQVRTSHITYRPSEARLTSVGPNPIAVGDRVLVNLESGATSGVAVAEALLDGVAVAGLVTFDEAGPTGYPWLANYFRINQEIPAGSVLAIRFTYTDADASGGERPSQRAWVTYWPADLNSPGQRAAALSQAARDVTPL